MSLRYKVEIRGSEKLTKENLSKKGGYLFLPNHPANIDPLILYMHLWPRFKMRPLVVEYVYRKKFLRAMMGWVKALPIPNLETAINEIKIKKAEESLKATAEGLGKGDAFLIYPAGRLKHGAREILGGASAAHSLLSRFPETNVVLIRTTGLWGSSFSRALEHKSPDLQKAFLHAFKVLLKNGLFFCKRRKVLIEIEPNPEGFPLKGSRLEINRYLENWYNQYPLNGQVFKEEPLTFVSYAFYKKLFLEVKEKKTRQISENAKNISPEDKEKILQEIAKIVQTDKKNITEEKNLALDLGMDSLDIASLLCFLSDRFDVEVYPEDIETVSDVIAMSAGQKVSSRESDLDEKHAWPVEEARPPIQLPQGTTITEAFFEVCARMGKSAAVADQIAGVLTYKKMQKAVIALALHFRSLKGKHVGVLLPSSSVAFIVVLALMAAKKVPVMLNWTLGPKFLNDTLKQTDSEVVISSWKFVEKLSYVEFGDMIDKIAFLEDIKKHLSFKTKMKALWTSRKSIKGILKALDLKDVHKDDEAVILFTSGTESVPKGVPLTHENILLNQRGSMTKVASKKDDIFFGVLPPFHSFGLSVAGLFPILAGLRIAFYPDPTDSLALAKGIKKWEATIFAAPPSFLKALLHVATKEDLKTLRLVISGAEKMPESLFEEVKKLGEEKTLIQGYGITECSPAVAINQPGEDAIGVGRPISYISCCTVHPETKKPLKPGEEGELCVSGPTVFKGYLDPSINPFLEMDGKKWYMTGDIGRCDEKGNIILSGRLKRFAKIGGEMISLGAIEETVLKYIAKDAEKPLAAVSSVEKDGKSFLVLFTTLVLDEVNINASLREAGFSRLVKISVIHKLDEIPITGTGKIDYRKLQVLGRLHAK